jgi:hypothetical protein
MTLGDFRELYNTTLKGLTDFKILLDNPIEIGEEEIERMKECYLAGQEYLDKLKGIVANWGM